MSSNPRKDLLVLRRITEYLSMDHVLEYALQEVTDAALELVPGDHASIRILDATRTALLATARSGLGREEASLSLGPGDGLAGWVLDHGVPALVDDVRQDARFMPAVGQGFAIGSMIAEPLLSGHSAIGVLSVSSGATKAFTAEDEQLARILANCSVPLLDKARLGRLTLTDPLTMAFNANYLRDRVSEEFARAVASGTALSLIAVGLDQLERITAAFGHDLTDSVLSLFAGRVRTVLRRYDAFIRCAEDEFVVVLPGTSPRQAMATAEHVRALAEEPLEPRPGARLTQTVSVGVATWDGGETVDQLLERAGSGMHAARQLGGNKVMRSAVDPASDA
jgi:diguanylate cyclase (GGDEF)-like protein